MDINDTLYARWLNNELSSEELEELKASGALKELEDIVQEVDQWQLPGYDVEAAFARQNLKKEAPPEVRQISSNRFFKVAASLILLVSLAFLLTRDREVTTSSANSTNQEIALSDGSSALLNDGSTLTYQTGTFSSARKVTLLGEALFEITKGETFTVETDKGSVEVLGTKFNVRSWGTKLYVACYEGRVQVTANGKSVTLTASESVNVVGGAIGDKEQINHSSPHWTQGVSKFYDEPTIEVFKELQRQYDVNFILAAPNKKFTGQFVHDDLQSAAESICLPLGLKYELSPDGRQLNVRPR